MSTYVDSWFYVDKENIYAYFNTKPTYVDDD